MSSALVIFMIYEIYNYVQEQVAVLSRSHFHC